MRIINNLLTTSFIFSKYKSLSFLLSTKNIDQKGVFSYSSNSSKSFNANQIKNIIPFHDEYTPKTKNQQIYYDYLNNPQIIILVVFGPAGSGKTIFACNNAIKQLKNGSIDKIIITRPESVSGKKNQKMDTFMIPILEIFYYFFSKLEMSSMIENNIIEISPLTYMTGRTFKNTYIIADDMQYSSPNQMLMLTTRIGEGSKMVIIGDLTQSDTSELLSGLADFIHRCKYYQGLTKEIQVVELDEADIKRSPIIINILDIYNKEIQPTLKMTSILSENSIASNISETTTTSSSYYYIETTEK